MLFDLFSAWGKEERSHYSEGSSVVAKKVEEIRKLSDEIRRMKPIADWYAVLFAEKRELRLKFDGRAATYHTLSKCFVACKVWRWAAADSRVKELTMVVGQVTAEN